MAVHALATNGATNKTGRVVAGSGSVSKAPHRQRPQPEAGGWRPVTQTHSAANGRHAPRPRTNAGKVLHATNKIRKKTTGSARALILTLTLLIPVAIQMGLAAILSYSVSFTSIGIIAWATRNFSIIESSGQIVFASLWVTLLFLNLLMFLYVIGAYTVTLVNVFTPTALVILGVCVACAIFPPLNIIPWVLVYVWAIALTR